MDWLVAIGRVFVVISAITGARRAYLRSRTEGPGMMVATALTTILLLVYIVVGVLLFTWYGVFAYPRLWPLAIAGGAVYLVGGIWLVARTGAYLDARARRRRN